MSSRTGPDRIVVEHKNRGALFRFAKSLIQMSFTVLATPRLTAYWIAKRALGERAFLGASESISMIPGLRGSYLRHAFYRHTLARCGSTAYIGWLSTFSMEQAELGENVYVGRRCSLGYARVGNEVMLADGVQILSGGHEHGVGEEGETHQQQAQTFDRVSIGEGAWLGTNVVVMADVGKHAIVGAGAVVTKPIPDYAVAVGIPAKVVKILETS